MRVLLLSMPDSFEHTPALTMRMPNGALASLAGNAGPEHDVAIADLILVQDRVLPTVERLMREHDPDVVGLSVMTFQRRTALRLIRQDPRDQAVRDRRRRRLRPEPGVRGVRGAVERRRLRRPRRRRADVPRAAARAVARGDRTRRRVGIPGLCVPRGAGRPDSRTRRRGPVSRLDDGDLELPESRRARAVRLHLPRPPDRHRRNLARLHLRLQLLLDHRDARAQLPHLRLHARAGRHRRRAAPRRARDLPGRRQHHAERRAVRGAVPGDRRRRPERHPLHRAGDDLVDREPRRRAGAADAEGGLSLRLPRHRERPRRGPRVPARVGQERAARRRTAGRQRDASRRSTRCTAPASPSSAASSSATPTTRARRSRRTSRSRSATSTGPTSSTRRRIRGRR